MPFWLVYRLADVMCFLMHTVARYRRRTVAGNLRRSFPEKTDSERTAIARRFYRNLADITLETFKTLTISDTELRRRVRILNPEVCLQHLNAGQSVVVMTSHLGNWEWLLAGHALQLGYDVDAVYKELTNPQFDAVMRRIRGRFGPHPVEMRQVARELVKRKAVTRIIAMVADQTPFPQNAYWTTFLHQDTAFFTGVAGIARRTGYPVLYVGMRRVRRGHYETWFEPLAEPPYTENAVTGIVETYVRRIEADIRRYPDQWLWSHKRWKHRRE